MNRKDLYTLLGFILFATGLTSIIFNIVGVEWVLLKWMSRLPGMIAFLIKLLMIITGMVTIYWNKGNWREN